MDEIRFKISADTLKSLLEILENVDDELPLIFNQDGVALKYMDPSHISMVDIFLDGHNLADWSNPSPEPVKTIINVKDLKWALEDIGQDIDAEFILQVTEVVKPKKAETDKDKPTEVPPEVPTEVDKQVEKQLDISLIVNVGRDKYPIPTLDYNRTDEGTPKLTFDATARITTSGLNKKFKKWGKKADHVAIEATNDALKISAFSGDKELIAETVVKKGDSLSFTPNFANRSLRAVQNVAELSLLDLSVTKESRASYSLSYMSQILPKQNLGDSVNLEFSQDMPCRISYRPEGFGDSRFHFYLAPRIE